jgi:hypothetical protein
MTIREPFDGMKECSFCESGTFDFVELFYEKTGAVVYCRKCWGELSLGQKPIDGGGACG